MEACTLGMGGRGGLWKTQAPGPVGGGGGGGAGAGGGAFSGGKRAWAVSVGKRGLKTLTLFSRPGLTAVVYGRWGECGS